MVLSIVKYLILICISVGFSCIIEHPKGTQYTPPVSVTMLVSILAGQFSYVFFMLWVCNTVREFLGMKDNWMIKLLSDTMDSAKGNINFCPKIILPAC